MKAPLHAECGRTNPDSALTPREEWIEVPVPALVNPAVFEAAQAQLAENRQRKRDSLRGPRWLLQGLTVCHRCGYAYYGKTTPKSSRDRSKGEYRQYRCIGTDGYRFLITRLPQLATAEYKSGTLVCLQRDSRGPQLSAVPERAQRSRVRAAVRH